MQNADLIQVVVSEVVASVVFLAYVEGWKVLASALVSVGVVGFLQSFGFFLTSVFTLRDQVRNLVGYRCREFALLQMVVRGIVGGGGGGENDDAKKARLF